MNYGLRGLQSKGKTALMVAVIKELLRHHGYKPDEVITNFMMFIEGTHYLSNEQMKAYLKSMIKEGKQHRIVGITEIDRLFPARFWQKQEQTDAILGLWQDEKCFNHIIWDAHIGSSVDLLLRQTTQIELLPEYMPANDAIPFEVLNTYFFESHWEICENVSYTLFPFYDRWEIIGGEKRVITPEEYLKKCREALIMEAMAPLSSSIDLSMVQPSTSEKVLI